MLNPQPIINQVLDHPLLEEKEVELSIKRLDWVHEMVPGNKFFKLKYNLEKAIRENKKTLLTFGGAYSNHIHAVANAAHFLGLNAIGIIRGEETLPLNPTLSDAKSKGMRLHYISRSQYRGKTDDSFIEELHDLFGDFYLIPEGGTNSEAIKGTQEILQEEDQSYSHISVSIGTGGTFTGILQASQSNQMILGFSSLKGNFIKKEIDKLIEDYSINPKDQFQVITDYHFGGYAKYDQSLIEFIWWFFESFGIVLDPVYTGKMLFGLWDLIKKGYFPKGSKILVIHSGGIQGNRGFTFQTGIKLPSL
ncbi:1-aminocyclopropane-1-carboxylate deaminase/D-cysteine desulfhydrase [Algoriphagus limi]|uniref:Pyridoxal-phosphate dependent enzyme n=1 Tax=Algoriphagus limi TaxID=2975273 RepID=A0ABT2G7W7_9BACT|nr:pyridoxal-phosphate dependent enzyme [Algoriphagus limi]MCS5491232.1 pyridoxal-phosphate dependent enzyme [Algoriphagus limi]